MAYQIPLRFIKASNEMALCATRIVAMMSTEAYQARRAILNEKRAGTLINAAGRNSVKTAIFLDNGTVVASPLTIRSLLSAIERSNAKQLTAPRESGKIRLRVYDVEDEEPREDLDIDMAEASVDDMDETVIDEIEEEQDADLSSLVEEDDIDDFDQSKQ